MRCLLPLLLTAAACHAEAVSGPVRQLRIHDPSTVVREGGAWWVFGTGPLLVSGRSEDLVSWTRRDKVLGVAPSWAAGVAPGNDRHYYWAPDVIRVGGLWFLYYSVSEFGKNTSAIGLATRSTLDPEASEPWVDRGIVVRSGEGSRFNAIDPGMLLDADGRLWLSFGSFWDGLFVVELDVASGGLKTPDAEPVRVASAAQIEAPTLYQKNGYTYLFINHGWCCRGMNSTYELRVGRARSPLGPFLDEAGRDLRDGGGTLVAGTSGTLIGPGHATVLEEGGRAHLVVHIYDGTANGEPRLALLPLAWSEDGWPRVAMP